MNALHISRRLGPVRHQFQYCALRPLTASQCLPHPRYRFPEGQTPASYNTNSSVVHKKSATSQTTSDINAPLSTLPAPLNLPERSAGDGKFSFYFKTGKAYLAFFKNGLKNIYGNYMLTRPLQDKIDKIGKGSITQLLEAQPNALSRSDFQLVMRTRHDVRRVPVFALIFIVFGEFSPLILPFVSGAVPYNCRIPKQLERERRRMEERREDSFKRLSVDNGVWQKSTLKDLSRPELLHVSRVLGLHARIWPESLGIPPTWWLRFRVRRRIEYLDIDDALLAHGGGVAALDGGEELTMAVIDRGINVQQKGESKLREDLKLWLKTREKLGGSISPAVWLTRPSEWASAPSMSPVRS